MKHAINLLPPALACLALSAGIAWAQSQSIPNGESMKINGVISSRNGPNMTIQQADNTTVVGVLDAYTQVQMKEGKLGFRKKTVDVTVLLPGLRVEVQGIGNSQGQLAVQKVELTAADLQAAREIQAGTATVDSQEQKLSAQEQKLKQQEQQEAQQEKQTQAAAQKAQQSANEANQRISNLNKYQTKYQTTVYFGNDQITLTQESKTSLDQLASQALATNAYMIQVAGYASSTGSAQLNEELSNQRSDAVIAYLTRSGHIPLFRVLAPAAMGASTTGGNDAAMNRRVVVKVVVNEGIAQ